MRSFVDSDLEAVRALHVHCFPVRYEDAFFRSLSTPRVLCLVALDSTKRVVGVASAFRKVRSTDTFCLGLSQLTLCYVATFGVHASQRKRGVGTLLWTALMREATALYKPDCFVLHVKTLNEDAINFYKKQHFQFVARKVGHYFISDRLYDAWKMCLPLNDTGQLVLKRYKPFLKRMLNFECCCGLFAKAEDSEIMDQAAEKND